MLTAKGEGFHFLRTSFVKSCLFPYGKMVPVIVTFFILSFVFNFLQLVAVPD